MSLWSSNAAHALHHHLRERNEMVIFKSVLASICGLVATTAMACGGDDVTATGSSDITSASSNTASSSSTANDVPQTLPGCSRGNGSAAADPNAGNNAASDPTTGSDPSSVDGTTNSPASSSVPCTAPVGGSIGNGSAAGTTDGTHGIGNGATG